jgi:hypothetical protein
LKLLPSSPFLNFLGIAGVATIKCQRTAFTVNVGFDEQELGGHRCDSFRKR